MNKANDSAPHSKPWLLSMRLITHVNRNLVCGASLIRVPYLTDSSDIAITAAHCAAGQMLGSYEKCYNKRFSMKNFEIEAANHKRDDPDGTEITVKVIDGQCHPDWTSAAYTNDIAILKLEKPLVFSDKIQPIELAERGERLKIGTICNVAGWGAVTKAIQDGWPTFPKVLQEADVKIVDCEKSKIGYNSTTQYCERGLHDRGHACDGDSGGALVCKKGDKLVQYGIVSFGTTAKGKGDDCNDIFEVLHSDVAYYRDWIDQWVQELNKGKNGTAF